LDIDGNLAAGISSARWRRITSVVRWSTGASRSRQRHEKCYMTSFGDSGVAAESLRWGVRDSSSWTSAPKGCFAARGIPRDVARWPFIKCG
jgi:hypothetical protein